MPRGKPKGDIGSFRDSFAPAIANLAAVTAVGAAGSNAVVRAATVLKARLVGNLDPDSANGPVLVVLTTDELSDSEVEEYLELSGPTDPGQVTQGEVIRRGRIIKELFTIPRHGEPMADQNYAVDFEASMTLSLREGHALRLVAYNRGSGALGASAAFSVKGNFVVRWHPE